MAEIGDTITVHLPGEITRAKVVRMVTPNAVLAQIVQFTSSQEHGKKRDSVIACLMGDVAMNQRGWRMVSDDELERAAKAEKRAARKKAKV